MNKPIKKSYDEWCIYFLIYVLRIKCVQRNMNKYIYKINKINIFVYREAQNITIYIRIVYQLIYIYIYIYIIIIIIIIYKIYTIIYKIYKIRYEIYKLHKFIYNCSINNIII